MEKGKVVRDRIPEIIEKGGRRPVISVLSRESAVRGLEAKLSEELGEYMEDHSLEELADLVEVIHGVLYHRGSSWDELEEIRMKKRAERGGFEKGIFLVGVKSAEDEMTGDE